MASLDELAIARELSTERLMLEPLKPEHADEMAPVLDDVDLYAFTGGEPVTGEELRQRYARQCVGRSPDGSQRWFNWILRRQDVGVVVGTTQATVTEEASRMIAEVAWVIAASHQGQGYAKEAAHAMAHWLRREGVTILVAHVHPRHTASMAVARSVGLTPTDVLVDGEVRWRTTYAD